MTAYARMQRLVVVIVMLTVMLVTVSAALAQDTLPLHPEAPDSHEAFGAAMKAARIASYQQLLSSYDSWLATHPDDIKSAVERCRFVAANDPDRDSEDDEDIGSGPDDCLTQLATDHPKSADAVLAHLQELWGEALTSFGEQAWPRTTRWKKSARAQLAKRVADAYVAQDKLDLATSWAKRARVLDGSVDVSWVFAKHWKSLDKHELAVAELLRDSDDDGYRANKIDMLLELGEFRQAARVIDATPKGRTTVNDLVQAKAFEGAGRIAEARAKYQALRAHSWFAPRALQRLYYLELSGKSQVDASRAYEAMRDRGYEADPLLRHRWSLFAKFPLAPWHLRDLLGFLSLLAFIAAHWLAMLLLILPIHYVGLLRRERAVPTTPAGTRWSLTQLWILLSSLLSVQLLGLYALLYEELDSPFDYGPELIARGPTALAHYVAFVVIVGACVTALFCRRSDYPALIRSSWSADRIASSVFLGVVGITLTHGAALLVARLFGVAVTFAGEKPAIVLATTRVLRSMFAAYGLGGSIVLIAIITPIYEELVFRGVFLTSAGRYLSFGWANVVQAAVFAAAHGEPLRAPGLFVTALIAGRLVQKSGGLAPAIALHMTINLIACVGLKHFE